MFSHRIYYRAHARGFMHGPKAVHKFREIYTDFGPVQKLYERIRSCFLESCLFCSRCSFWRVSNRESSTLVFCYSRKSLIKIFMFNICARFKYDHKNRGSKTIKYCLYDRIKYAASAGTLYYRNSIECPIYSEIKIPSFKGAAGSGRFWPARSSTCAHLCISHASIVWCV